MSALMRFDPFRDFDRLAEQIVQSGGRGSPRSFPMDAYRRGDQFFVHLDLPGVEAESIELTAENNVLTVSADGDSNRRMATNSSSGNGRKASSSRNYC